MMDRPRLRIRLGGAAEWVGSAKGGRECVRTWWRGDALSFTMFDYMCTFVYTARLRSTITVGTNTIVGSGTKGHRESGARVGWTFSHMRLLWSPFSHHS